MRDWSSCKLDQACFTRSSQLEPDIEELGAEGLWTTSRLPLIADLSTERRKGSFIAIGEVGEQGLDYQSGDEDECSMAPDRVMGSRSC